MANHTTVIKADRMYCGISDRGQVMGKESEAALASVEKEGIYEHLAADHLEEGYTLAYRIGGSEHVKYDVYASHRGIVEISNCICKNNDQEFIKMIETATDDGYIKIQQLFTFAKNSCRLLIQMNITNCSKESYDLEDFLIKRFADLDVDTLGSAGWADFKAHWDKTRYSVFSYNLEDEAPTGKRSHVVNMMALPSDLPLDDVFIGYHGDRPFKTRPNSIPVDKLPSERIDADGVLQWRARRFLAGESFRINMCYDCYESFFK